MIVSFNVAPCKNCPLRELNCHASCREYEKWAKHRNEVKEYIARQRSLENDIRQVTRRRERGG